MISRPLASTDPHTLGALAAAETFDAPVAVLAEDLDFLTDLAIERCPFANGSDEASEWILDFSCAFALAAGVTSPSWI